MAESSEGAGKERILDADTRAMVEGIKGRLGSIQQKSKQWTHSGQWLKSGVVHYSGLDGKERPYEMVQRTTKKGNCDSVDVIGTGENYTHTRGCEIKCVRPGCALPSFPSQYTP